MKLEFVYAISYIVTVANISLSTLGIGTYDMTATVEIDLYQNKFSMNVVIIQIDRYSLQTSELFQAFEHQH